MRIIKIKKLTLAVFASYLITLAPIASAEIWKCQERFISKETKPAEHCQVLSSSILCGSDGNKYITRSNPDYPVVSEYCKFNKNSKNIFADHSDLANVKSAKQKEAASEDFLSGLMKSKSKPPKAKGNAKVPNLAGKGPQEILNELFKNPQSINELAKLVFPSLQEDFSD